MILKETALTSVLNRLKNLFSLKSKTVFSVNGEEPVDGNVTLLEVPLAANLSSDKTQESLGEFIIRTSGGSASISDGDAFALRILGNREHTGYVPESLMMAINAASRTIEDQPITAEIDRDTFVAYVADSGTITLTYTTEWSANPALYGITVTGTPVDGDEIVVVYVKENRGTITVANPTALKSTGWNLYNHTAGYAYATKYSDDYGFMIGGTYTAVKFATTADAVEKTTITPVDGMFSIPSDGYIFVEGGNNTDTFIINVWSDWTDGPVGAFEAYSETEVNLATIMQTYFTNGLLRVGNVRDEINLNTATAISRIDRMAYSTANLATAKASGRAYEYDTNYIYIVKAVYDVNDITLDGSYTASDHGNEFFTGTTIPVYIETLYGNNLKNKLERDVVTKSQDIVNNLTTNDATKALSAAMGNELNSKLFDAAFGTSSDADLQSKLITAASKLQPGEMSSINFYCGYASDWIGINYGVYSGVLTRYDANFFAVKITATDSSSINIINNNGTWHISNLNNKIAEIAGDRIAYDIMSLSELQTLISNKISKMVDGSAAHCCIVCTAAFDIFANGDVFSGFIHKATEHVYQFNGISIAGKDVSVSYNWGAWTVKSLNSKFTTIANLTPVSGVTMNSGYFIQVGKIVVFDVFVTFDVQKTTFNQFITGLPGMPSGGDALAFACNYDGNNTFCILSYGSLYVGKSIGTAEAGKSLRVTGAYISN